MTNVGFQLKPFQIAETIHEDIGKDGWHLREFLDHYQRPDFDTGMMVLDPVDRAVVVFVGPRKEAAIVADAARKALAT